MLMLTRQRDAVATAMLLPERRYATLRLSARVAVEEQLCCYAMMALYVIMILYALMPVFHATAAAAMRHEATLICQQDDVMPCFDDTRAICRYVYASRYAIFY